jgi:tetratricopeptide (TPR) repeat protein
MKIEHIVKIAVCFAIIASASSCSAEVATTPAQVKSEAAKVEAPMVAPETVAVPAPAAPKEASKYDFSDSSHWNLTVSAWEHMAQKDFEGTFAYAQKCLELFEVKAKEAARKMHTFVGFGHEDDFAVVNDVATSHYIMGEAYMKLGNTDKALEEFNLIIQEYPYAQCWDPKGWFWKVAEVSKKNIEKIEKGTVAK